MFLFRKSKKSKNLYTLGEFTVSLLDENGKPIKTKIFDSLETAKEYKIFLLRSAPISRIKTNF